MKKFIITTLIALATVISVHFADAAAPPATNGSSVVEPSGCDNGDVSRYGNQLVRGQIVKILNPVTHVFDFFLVGGPSNNQDIMALVSLASGDMFPINPEGTYSVLGLGTTLYLKQGFNAYPQNYNGGLEPADFD